MPKLMSYKEAREYLQVSRATFYRLVLLAIGYEGVDHYIADEVNPVRTYALIGQAINAGLLGDEEQVAYAVCQDSVDLFGHLSVETSQAGFDVNEFYAEFNRNKSACDRAVYIADDENVIGFEIEHYRFEAFHYLSGLDGMTAGADLEIDIRLGDIQLVKEELAHVLIVVLPGVNEQSFEVAVFVERTHDRCDLHKVGPRPADADDLSHCIPP